MNELIQEQPKPYLVHPKFDTLIVAGMSVLFLLPFIMGNFLRNYFSSTDVFLNAITSVFLSLLFWVNYPHFMMSYRLAYSRGLSFALKYWFELIAVPLLMTGLFCFALLNPEFMELSLRASISAMLVLSGWHYAMQFFGCVMVASNYEKYELDQQQRSFLKFNFLSIWWLTIVSLGKPSNSLKYYEITPLAFQLPKIFEILATAAVLISTFCVICFVFKKNNDQGKTLPTSIFVPWVTFFLWFSLANFSGAFFIVLVPFFHSLQYFAFVHRVERVKAVEEKQDFRKKAVVAYLGLVLAGYLGFEFIPRMLTSLLQNPAEHSLSFFPIAALVFINIHHFFLDRVLWKFDQKFIRSYLLAKTR